MVGSGIEHVGTNRLELIGASWKGNLQAAADYQIETNWRRYQMQYATTNRP